MRIIRTLFRRFFFKKPVVEKKEYVETDTKCDKCEFLRECIANGEVIDVTGLDDNREHYISVIGSECKK